ncbi:MAG: hypothetical protein QOF27_2458 [Gaiellaceae bacterium]|nr:hypothetical protein [Gaiellaceae bacterium]
MGAAIALADAPGTGPAVKALGESPDAQVGPAVAVNPAGGSPNILAAIVGTDWRGGGLQPQSAVSTGSIVAATGATTWASQTTLPHTSPDFSHGSPDIAWGPGNKVYAVEVARDTDDTSNPCLAGAGVYLFVSNNGGVSWGPEIEIAPNGTHQSNTDPSIAYDSATGRIYVAYTKTDPCSANPGDPSATSQVRMVTLFRDDAVGGTPISTIPQTPGAQTQIRPSVVVLPNGRSGIAYYDATPNVGNVLFTTCSAPTGTPPKPVCGNPVTIDDSASGPTPPALPGVQVRPRAAADPTGRVVVTWSKMTDTTNMDVFSATSRNSGATFGVPQLVSVGPSNQINPSIAIDPVTGRADIAFLDSRYTTSSYVVADSASNPPGSLGTAESWSASVPVESTPVVPTAPYVPGPPNIGDRLGVAQIPRASGPPWTLIAWTDTRGATDGTPRNEDVYSTVLLHGTTAPVGVNSDGGAVQRNVPVNVPIGATDLDADPLTFGIAQQGSNGTAFVSDANKPQFTYTGTTLGPDQVKVLISDGTSQTTATITVQVVNTPPTITCTSLATPLNKAISLAGCVQDANGDAVSLDASAPQHGTVQRINGDLMFVPDTGFVGTAQVTLTATDGIDAASPKTITIQVGTPGETPVTIVGDAARSAFTDRPITLTANTTVTGADSSKISWSFTANGKTSDQGPTVAHLFSKVGKYTVTAHVGTGPSATVTVFAQKPPISITSTDLGKDGALALRVQLGRPGKLAVSLLGVRGAAHRTMKLKLGTHTIHMALPASVRARGTVIVKLRLTASGVTRKIRRAVMLPSP